MLYLQRKLGESIIINGEIEVKVTEIRGKSVKLGFDFPPSATILRKEIHDNVVEENRSNVEDQSDMQDLSDLLGDLQHKSFEDD